MMSQKYYHQIEKIIKDYPIVTHFLIDFDDIDIHTAYLKGRLELINGSVIDFIEYVELQDSRVIRPKYKYQWQSGSGDLIAWWDNVPHHQEIDTSPYHMHDKKRVYASVDMDLNAILDIVMDKVIL